VRRAPSSAILGLAPAASGSERTHSGRRLRSRRPLLEQLTVAAQQDDREEFDRLFDRCFERVYTIAWCITRERARAEVITAQILCQAVIEAV
jgi:hypothetical protein